MKMERLNSGKLKAAGYDSKSGTLRVELEGDTVLEYSGIGGEVWRRLSSSGSAWSYYRDNIEEEYSSRRVSGKPASEKNPLDDLFTAKMGIEMEETWVESDLKKYDGMMKYPEIFYLPGGWVILFTTNYGDQGFLVKSKSDRSPREFKTLDDAGKFLYSHGYESTIVTLYEYPIDQIIKKSKHAP